MGFTFTFINAFVEVVLNVERWKKYNIKKYNIIKNERTFYSQDNQDKILEHFIFKGYNNGFYVYVGAHDGVSINNTLYFNKYNNWNGINIEPIKEVFDKLVINRPNDINLNLDISLTMYNDGCFLNDHIDGKSPVKNYASMLIYLNKKIYIQ